MSLFDHMYKLADAPPGQVVPGVANHVSPSDGSHPPSAVPPAALGMSNNVAHGGIAPQEQHGGMNNIVHGTGIPGLRPDFMPLPHQINAVRRLIENDGKMIMAHAMGSGKSATSIYGYEKLKQLGRVHKLMVVVPAGLRENYLEGAVKRFTTDRGVIAHSIAEIDPTADVNIVSYDLMRSAPDAAMQRSGADMLTLDEFQHVRNGDASTYAALWRARQYVKSFCGLTGSPINNSATELAPLLALSENNPHLTKADFRSKFVKTVGAQETFTGKTRKIYGIKNPAEFALDAYPKIDLVETSDVKGNVTPKKILSTVPVPMSNQQWRQYQQVLGRTGALQKLIEEPDSHFAPPEAAEIFTKMMRARQISNSVGVGRTDMTPAQAAEKTPKIHRLIQDTVEHLKQRADNSVVISSSMINGGINELSAALAQAGIPHGLFVGKGTEINGRKVTEKSRQADAQEFKDGKKRVILISPAGYEGLDFKDSSALFSLDASYNPENTLQMEARAVRLGGQAARAPEDRKVDVRRYTSVAPQSETPGFWGSLVGQKAPRSVDTWVADVARAKHVANKPYLDVLHAPYKYIRKEHTPSGGVRYVYKEPDNQGLWGRMFGTGNGG